MNRAHGEQTPLWLCYSFALRRRNPWWRSQLAQDSVQVEYGWSLWRTPKPCVAVA